MNSLLVFYFFPFMAFKLHTYTNHVARIKTNSISLNLEQKTPVSLMQTS